MKTPQEIARDVLALNLSNPLDADKGDEVLRQIDYSGATVRNMLVNAIEADREQAANDLEILADGAASWLTELTDYVIPGASKADEEGYEIEANKVSAAVGRYLDNKERMGAMATADQTIKDGLQESDWVFARQIAARFLADHGLEANGEKQSLSDVGWALGGEVEYESALAELFKRASEVGHGYLAEQNAANAQAWRELDKLCQEQQETLRRVMNQRDESDQAFRALKEQTAATDSALIDARRQLASKPVGLWEVHAKDEWNNKGKRKFFTEQWGAMGQAEAWDALYPDRRVTVRYRRAEKVGD